MNLSYNSRNVIHSENIKVKGKITLKNNIASKEIIEEEVNLEQKIIEKEEELRKKIEEAEYKYNQIIAQAKEESLSIISESEKKALDIEKKAYEEGYNQGTRNGYEDGYKEAYDDNIEKAKVDSQNIIDNASNVLEQAKKYVTGYMKENKENILNISISIAEQVLREKFDDVSSMNSIIVSIIEEHELRESFIIKVNNIYKECLDTEIETLKENYKINKGVFVLGDDSINKGNAVIETSNGKLIIGIDSVIDEIKKELL